MSATMAARARTGASLSAPVRRPQQAARRKSTPWIARVLRSAAQHPGRALIFLAFALASVAIVTNALMFQRARHPHPMMTYAPAAESSRPAAAAPARRAEPAPAAAVEAPAAPAQAQPALPALPPTRPSALSQTQAPREAAPRPPAAVSTTARSPAPAAAPAATRAAPMRDPIADLINGGEMRPPADVGGRASAQRRASTN